MYVHPTYIDIILKCNAVVCCLLKFFFGYFCLFYFCFVDSLPSASYFMRPLDVVLPFICFLLQISSTTGGYHDAC